LVATVERVLLLLLEDAEELPHALRSRVAPIARNATGAECLARAVLLL
jgi:hypothetical protein